MDEIAADIAAAARLWPGAHRVFLADGDAYGLPTEMLAEICQRLAVAFPALQRVTAYATPFNILRKSTEEIARLKALKLSLVYLGLETGDDALLKRIKKGSARQMQAALELARDSGLKVSATVILGLTGEDGDWQSHMAQTAALVNAAPPTYLSCLNLTVTPETLPRWRAAMGESFQMRSDAGTLDELERLIAGLAPPRPVIFRSNHASNALALAGTLPKDRTALLEQIAAARAGLGRLRPRWMRGL